MTTVNRFVLTVAVLLSARPVTAQVEQAAITGAVMDQSDARVARAKVTVTNIRTSVSSTTITNADGYYSIPYLTPGEYNVVVESAGFKKGVVSGIALRVGFTATVDVTLEVGA